MNEAFLEADRVGNSQTAALYKHGAHLNPHLETIAASDASSNTSKQRKWSAFMHIPCNLWHKLLQAYALWKGCTCPFAGWDMKDILGQGVLYLVKSWLFITGIICEPPLPCVGSQTVFQERKTMKIAKGIQVYFQDLRVKCVLIYWVISQ